MTSAIASNDCGMIDVAYFVFECAGLLAMALIPMIAFSGIVQLSMVAGKYGDSNVRTYTFFVLTTGAPSFFHELTHFWD